MTITFTLHQDHAPSLPRRGEAIDAIEDWLASRFPTKSIALKRDPKPYCKLFAGCPAIWDAKRWPTLIRKLRYPEGSEKLHRQTLSCGVLLESQSGPLLFRP